MDLRLTTDRLDGTRMAKILCEGALMAEDREDQIIVF